MLNARRKKFRDCELLVETDVFEDTTDVSECRNDLELFVKKNLLKSDLDDGHPSSAAVLNFE